MTEEEQRRDRDIEKRFQELESELDDREESGAKKADLDRARKASRQGRRGDPRARRSSSSTS